MSLLMIHKAYMPVYSDPDFSCGTDGTDGTGRTDQPKVVQEVLADLKMGKKMSGNCRCWCRKVSGTSQVILPCCFREAPF